MGEGEARQFTLRGVKGKPCAVVENGMVCGRPHEARGMCQLHYERWYSHGDTRKPKPSEEELRFRGGSRGDRQPLPIYAEYDTNPYSGFFDDPEDMEEE